MNTQYFNLSLHWNQHLIQVEAILVNIFGGIVNCATIANGIIQACKEISLKIPLIVRLEGKGIIINTLIMLRCRVH